MAGTVITFASMKGGVTKSTHVAALSFGLAAQGYRVFVIDFDEQGTSENFINLATPIYPTFDGLNVTDYVTAAEANKLIVEKADEYDYVIIDTAGSASQSTSVCMVSADLVLSPFTLTEPEIKGLHATMAAFQKACETYGVPLDEQCAFIGLYRRAAQFASKDALKELEAISGDIVIRNGLRHSNIITDWMASPYALIGNKSLVDIDPKKASPEQKLSNHCFDLAEIVKGLFVDA